MDQAGRRQVTGTSHDDSDVFRTLRHLTSQDFRLSFVRFLRGRIAIFHVRGDLGQDAWCFRTVFVRGPLYVGFHAAVRNDLSTRYRRGAIKTFFLGGLFCRVDDRKRRVRLVDGSLKDLGNYSVQIGRCQVSAFFFRNLRYL